MINVFYSSLRGSRRKGGERRGEQAQSMRREHMAGQEESARRERDQGELQKLAPELPFSLLFPAMQAKFTGALKIILKFLIT